MDTLDKYVIIELRNGQSWCVMPEDYDDIKRAVKAYNEESGDYANEGKDELLELRGTSGAEVCMLASAIHTFTLTTLESRARNSIIEDRIAVDIEEEKNRILREEAQIRAVAS
jgi:hypothetical protein